MADIQGRSNLLLYMKLGQRKMAMKMLTNVPEPIKQQILNLLQTDFPAAKALYDQYRYRDTSIYHRASHDNGLRQAACEA